MAKEDSIVDRAQPDADAADLLKSLPAINPDVKEVAVGAAPAGVLRVQDEKPLSAREEGITCKPGTVVNDGLITTKHN